MRIQHNIMAMNAYRNYNNNTSALSKNLEKLSSGYKINRAGDDAAGLAISEKMRAQITGLKAASKNVKDGVSLVKTAEGALQEVHDMLNRMDSLATQSANGTYDNEVDRLNLQKEVKALQSEIDRIADSSNFNGTKLLNGDLGGYKNTTAITAVAGVRDADCMTVSGGKLANGDYFELKHATADGAVTLEKVKVGGVEIESGDFATKGIQAQIVKPKDKDGNDTTTGTWTIKITVDKTKATADIADAVGDGLTITYNALGKPGADDTVKFTTDGTGDGLELQIGDTADKFNKLKVNVGDMHAKGLGIDKVDISSQTGAAAAIQSIKDAINTVSSTRGDLGALQNRLEHTSNNLSVMTENIQDAESTIRDTDVADEMMAYTKNNILIQSAQAMLAQANQVPQGVLQLLQ
ncbi:flagellin [Intestinimonas sp. MSJ-38]|uniref:flagellin N-terminal helical domain-containing protein n=1 Tax=Intestinimonas sp. MSJ-38 TaxID=2841532 RepID=UPI001C120799|nr:flagellin [Intestinimonas sp. MSJ-38]MBU5432739.1 flagellin [Intestinimonas sp. MSJ-38]